MMDKRQYIGIDHIALQVPVLQQGISFFHDLLGFRLVREVEFDGMQIVMLKAGKIEIEMWQAKAPGQNPVDESGIGVHHLAFRVKDLEAAVGQMKSLGIPVLKDIYMPTRGIREALVEGPGCLRLQFVEQNVPLLIWRTLKGEI